MTTSNRHKKPATFLGIDVGKKDLYCHCITDDGSQSEVFENSSVGIKLLQKLLAKHSQGTQCHICLEQTGHYGKAVANALWGAGHDDLYVVNPQQIKAFSQRKLRRNKSDSADAKLIAQFIRSEHSELRKWAPRDIEHEQVMELSRYAESLTEGHCPPQDQMRGSRGQPRDPSLAKAPD